MRLIHFTDLHLECGKIKVTNPPIADVVVVCGDLGAKTTGWPLIQSYLDLGYYVILILGNHEHHNYGSSNILTMSEINQLWKEKEAKNDKFFCLINESVIINGVKFIGATAWTSFNNGSNTSKEMFHGLKDSVLIYKSKVKVGYKVKSATPVTSDDILNLHYESMDYLQKELSVPFEGVKILCTHHPLLLESNSPEFTDNEMSGCYVSDYDDLFNEHKIDYYFHGHTHHKNEYIHKSGCHVYSNPLGYKSTGEVNDFFDINMIVDIIN